MKNVELKIYECLGIKYFKKLMLNLRKILLWPFSLIKNKELKKEIENTSDNYVMKKGNGLQDLKDFKNKLLYNTIVHVVAMLFSFHFFFSTGITSIVAILFSIFNAYCIMLQRYNQIRINKVIKRYEKLEDGKRSKLKEEIINKDKVLKSHTYELKGRRKNTELNLECFLDKASLKELKELKSYLESVNKNDLFATLWGINVEKQKVLRLKYKEDNFYFNQK